MNVSVTVRKNVKGITIVLLFVFLCMSDGMYAVAAEQGVIRKTGNGVDVQEVDLQEKPLTQNEEISVQIATQKGEVSGQEEKPSEEAPAEGEALRLNATETGGTEEHDEIREESEGTSEGKIQEPGKSLEAPKAEPEGDVPEGVTGEISEEERASVDEISEKQQEKEDIAGPEAEPAESLSEQESLQEEVTQKEEGELNKKAARERKKAERRIKWEEEQAEREKEKSEERALLEEKQAEWERRKAEQKALREEEQAERERQKAERRRIEEEKRGERERGKAELRAKQKEERAVREREKAEKRAQRMAEKNEREREKAIRRAERWKGY
ncbi:MAG: hypothetical protein MRJ65_07225 [Candidatus Brocadiaceae bacterium]|nr:hypothetical protein [Candidatus Brocadiaceae bacterium]